LAGRETQPRDDEGLPAKEGKSASGVYIDDLSEYGVNLVQKYPDEIRQYEVLLNEGYFKQIGQPTLIKVDVDKVKWYEVELEELGVPLRIIN